MTVSARDHSPFEYHGGLHLRDTILWMDAVEARSICFVSHAGVAGAQEHQKIISTAETAELLRSLAATHGRGRKVRSIAPHLLGPLPNTSRPDQRFDFP